MQSVYPATCLKSRMPNWLKRALKIVGSLPVTMALFGMAFPNFSSASEIEPGRHQAVAYQSVNCKIISLRLPLNDKAVD